MQVDFKLPSCFFLFLRKMKQKKTVNKLLNKINDGYTEHNDDDDDDGVIDTMMMMIINEIQ